jgi:hypothetical protein
MSTAACISRASPASTANGTRMSRPCDPGAVSRFQIGEVTRPISVTKSKQIFLSGNASDLVVVPINEIKSSQTRPKKFPMRTLPFLGAILLVIVFGFVLLFFH